MAKLVEHVPTETVDSVKRRFLRQNRELARVNSSHSTRIGNLESKIASLISENLELRQQIIMLEHSREQWITRKCFDVRMKIQLKVKEIEELLDAFEMSAKDAIYASPDGASDSSSCRRDSLDSVVGVPASAIHVSTRKKSSPKVPVMSPPAYPDLDAGGDDGPQVDYVTCDNRPQSPQPKESYRFAPEELSAEEIPESPSESSDSVPLPNIISGTDTVRPRRKRRDSLQEMDIVSMVKTQNANYKAKLSQRLSAPVLDDEHKCKFVESQMVVDDGVELVALPEYIPPSRPEPVPLSVPETKRSEIKTTATKRRLSVSVNDGTSDTVDNSTKRAPSSRPLSRRSSVSRENLPESKSSQEARELSPLPANRRASRRSSIYREPATDTAGQLTVPSDEARMKLGESDKNTIVSKHKKSMEKAVKPERRALQPVDVNLEPDAGNAGVTKHTKPPAVRQIEIEIGRVRPAGPNGEDERQVSTSPEGGRRTGRARKSVNYALPSLRVKMRREQDQFVDAIVVPDQNEDKLEPQNQGELKLTPAVEVKIKQEDTDELKTVDYSTIPDASRTAAAGLDGDKPKWGNSSLLNPQDAVKLEPTDHEPVREFQSQEPRVSAKTTGRPVSLGIPPYKIRDDIFEFAAVGEADTSKARRMSGIPASASRIGIAQGVDGGSVNGRRRPNRQAGVDEDGGGKKTTTATKRRLSMVA
ncbi:hypothetical protein V1517DRAFT_330439 [Lipomyces orientalis]|uniref:Uncharacterized protein n=1 Tax=Lipomyces orientalis TaxID=1233043 RepID=A0ACC3TG32_9ASCO